ncbi:hypothetical protein BJ944DRAFT_188548 [Cunninghamella echinulata]|nr:hypothetical protein BJ944DRAFT_188548 [Cunninghamella echinulata]
MHLRVDTSQPYTLFPTKQMYSLPPPTSTTSSSTYQPFTLPYPLASNTNNGYQSKRSSSAFEPLFYHPPHPQSQQTYLSPPPTPTTASTIPPLDLADFSATIVYLMWHSRKSCTTGNRMNGNASPAFKRFCFQVLTSTQLTESAVYLGLKYICHLLESNPSIEGAEGSEYRLFIVALMLANKFLDDNTFTNKTWSEVSGMKVQDLNIMESEFLEALEYTLFVREDDYKKWKSILDYCRGKMATPCWSHVHQRQNFIISTLQCLGLHDSNKTLTEDIESSDDSDDSDDDEFYHSPLSATSSSPTSNANIWSINNNSNNNNSNNNNSNNNSQYHQLYIMQQQQHYSSATPATTSTPTSTLSHHQQGGPIHPTTIYSNHRSSSSNQFYNNNRSSIPPGFHRRSSPWDPLNRYDNTNSRCGDSLYHYHPYQRNHMIPPIRSATTTNAWCE